MTKRIAITVGPAEIAAGVPGDGNGCPIALAIRGGLPANYASVDVSYIEIGVNRGEVYPFRYEPTEEMRRFIEAFDDGRPVSPVTFFLDVWPDSVVALWAD